MTKPHAEHVRIEKVKLLLQEIIEFAKNEMNIEAINAHIYYENNKSIKLVEKFGFIYNKSYTCKFRGKDYLHNIYKVNLNKQELLKKD